MDKKEKALGKKESEVHDGIGGKMRKKRLSSFHGGDVMKAFSLKSCLLWPIQPLSQMKKT